MRQKIASLLLISVLTMSLQACRSTSGSPAVSTAAGSRQRVDLYIFAAASLTGAFDELAVGFEAEHQAVNVIYNFAGSHQLAQQIAVGAPVDVFASANQAQMDAAVASERILAADVKAFINNRLVVIYPADNPAGLETLEDLAKPGLRLVLAAGEVPVGEYSLEFLEKAELAFQATSAYKQRVLSNVVSYENNVKAVLTKVMLGEADAGIVYSSDITDTAATRLGQIEIPEALNMIATYSLAPLADSAHQDLARAFIDYVISPAGQVVLEKYGFTPVGP